MMRELKQKILGFGALDVLAKPYDPMSLHVELAKHIKVFRSLRQSLRIGAWDSQFSRCPYLLNHYRANSLAI